MQYPQQFNLAGSIQVTDLVQKYAAPVGLLKTADSVMAGIGESAFFMAEHFTFKQSGGNSTEIDFYKRLITARTVLMDRLGDQFLTRAAFTKYQNRRVSPADTSDSFQYG